MARPHFLTSARLLLGLSLALGTLMPGCAPPAAPSGTPRLLTAQQVPDPTFGLNGVVTTDFFDGVQEVPLAIALMPDGRIVVAGSAQGGFAARYLADGSVDTSFGTGGIVELDDHRVSGPLTVHEISGVTVLPTGQTILIGSNHQGENLVMRLLENGQLDPTFGQGGAAVAWTGGFPADVVVQQDGRILVAGDNNGFMITRYTADGQLDSSWGQAGTVTTLLPSPISASRIRVDGSGRVVVAGDGVWQDNTHVVVVRYLPDGRLDATFGQGGISTIPFLGATSVTGLGIQPDGRIVIGGTLNADWTDGFGFSVLRLDSQGTPDWTFGGGDGLTNGGPGFGGGSGTSDLIIRRNGKILLSGSTSHVFTEPYVQEAWGLAQFNPDGTLDTTFGDQGRSTYTGARGFGGDLVLQPDGRYVMTGFLDLTGCVRRCHAEGREDVALARFTPTDGDAATPPGDPPPLPPLSAPLTVTASGQSSSTEGAALTVPVGSTPVIETTLGSAVTAQRLSGTLSAQSIAPGTPLTGAEVYLDGVGWSPMSAVDGAFDSPSEAVRATLPPLTQTGLRTVCVRAVSGLDRGTAGCAPLNVAVQYQFGGFLRPVDPLPTVNTVKAGAAVPVKFSLGGDFGLNVLASGSPRSAGITCDPSAAVDPVEQTVTASVSGLQYDPVSGTYTYVWKTDRSWGGSCRQFTLTLQDGSVATARFRFSK